MRALRRSFTFGAGLALEDEVVLDTPQEIVWVFLSRPRPQLTADGLLLGTVCLRYDRRLDCAVEEMPVTDSRMARNFPGSLWRVTLTQKPSAHTRQTFRFTPEA